jgi:hypothetical protein
MLSLSCARHGLLHLALLGCIECSHSPPPSPPLPIPHLPPSFSHAAAAVARSTRSLDVVSLADLPMTDLAIICELEDEQNRGGHFTRIFPTSETRYYHQFFENPNKCVHGAGSGVLLRCMLLCPWVFWLVCPQGVGEVR